MSAPQLRVLIGADSLLSARSGVGRMTLEIIRAAQQHPGIAQANLLVRNEIMDAGRAQSLDTHEVRPPIPWKVMVGQVPGVQVLRLIKNGTIRRHVAALANQSAAPLIYHEPNMIVRRLRLPTVSTMNDLSWHHEPAWHPKERLIWIDRNLGDTLRRARRFIAISQFTKDAVVRELGVPADRVDVVPLAPAPGFRPMTAEAAAAVLARHGLVDRGYILSVSTLEPRKNFDRLLHAYLSLPPLLRARNPLVIAGGKGWGSVMARPEADAALHDGSLRLLGHIDDDDLLALTARARVFAYVSLYEGFGLPVVEAMAAGCPVVASSTTAVGEVAADAARLVDPLDEASIADGLRAVLEDPAVADRLRLAGLARAAGFTWAATTDHLVTSWRRALAS